MSGTEQTKDTADLKTEDTTISNPYQRGIDAEVTVGNITVLLYAVVLFPSLFNEDMHRMAVAWFELPDDLKPEVVEHYRNSLASTV